MKMYVKSSVFDKARYGDAHYYGLPVFKYSVGEHVHVPFDTAGVAFLSLRDGYDKRRVEPIFISGEISYVSPTNRWATVDITCANGNRFKESFFVEDIYLAEQSYKHKRKEQTA